MNDPIQLLYLGRATPDLATSSWGPFVVHAIRNREEASEAMGLQRYDAVVLESGPDEALADWSQWPGLSRALLDSAVLLVAPEPTPADALRLIQLGVQDVLPPREATPDGLARAVRLAVARERLDQAARKAYATDLATGLPNRAQLMEHMTHLLALREREPASMALLALRLEGLAATEARLGTEAAHVLRRKVAVRLRAGLRASDVVASVGADTFVVLLAWIDDMSDGERVATKLAQSLQRPFSITGQDVAVAVRVGVARYPEQGKEALQLLGLALDSTAVRPAQGRVGLTAQGAPSGRGAANDE